MIVERSIGQYLVAKDAQKDAEILDTGRKTRHSAPIRSHRSRRLRNDFAPLRSAIRNQNDVTNFVRLKRCPRNSRLLDQFVYFRQSCEFKSSTHPPVFPNFGGELVLSSNPGMIKRGNKFSDPSSA